MPWPPTVGQAFHTRTVTAHGPTSFAVTAGALGVPASVVWPAAQTALFFPFRIAQDILVKGFFWMNGTTVNGNTDCGIYSVDGTKIISTGAIAQATTSATQVSALGTAKVLSADVYYLALLSSSATATYFSSTVLGVEELRHCGVTKQTLAGVTLPAIANMTLPTSTSIPVFGLYTGIAP